MEFSALNPKLHNRKGFDCGVKALNRYLQQVAGQDQKRNLSKVYVLAEGESIVGYYSLSAHSPGKIYLRTLSWVAIRISHSCYWVGLPLIKNIKGKALEIH